MQLDELLGQPLPEAKRILGSRLLAVEISGLSRQVTENEEHHLRVVRVRQLPTGCRLTVVLPPAFEESF